MDNDNLKDFIETASKVSPFRVENDYGGGYVRLRSEEAERRQAIHDIRSSEDVVIEALRNSRDAHARMIFLATAREGDLRKIVMIDDGDGIPPYMHKRIFEPRVTSKLDSAHLDKWGVHGRGMALYSIAVNCDVAKVVCSDIELGAALSFTANCRTLGEKADQSTFPTFELTDGGTVSVRGPKNIVRTACEFAVDSAPTCSVFIGTPAEIAATLYTFGLSTLSPSQRAFADYPEQLPVCKRLGIAADPASFCMLAEGLGLHLSERTCRRIMNGQISAISALTDRISIRGNTRQKGSRKAPKSRRIPDDSRGLKIDASDLEIFEDGIEQAYGQLARDYFLDAGVKAEIKVSRDRISISIPVKKL